MARFSLPRLLGLTLAAGLASFVATATPAAAAALAVWNPSGIVDTSQPLPPASVSPSLTAASSLAGGPGVNADGTWSNAYVLGNWTTGAFDANDYLAFSTTGNNVTYTTVVFSLCNNFDGSGNWEIRSSADNFATMLDGAAFSNIAAGLGGGAQISANVAAIGQRSGAVQFRIYTYANAGTTSPQTRGICGTGQIGGQGLTVNGSAGPATAAPVVFAPALGDGRWLLLAVLLLAAWRRLATMRARR